MKKIAFILSKFPCYDEAFILRELHELSGNMDFLIFSLKGAGGEAIVHDEAQALLKRTLYIPYFSPAVAASFFGTVLRNPVKAWQVIAELVSGQFKSGEFLAKSLALLPKVFHFARLAKERGITHIHAYWATYPATAALAVSRLTGIPFSFTGHAHDIYLDTTFLDEKIRSARFVTTCTSQNKDHLAKIGGNGSEEKILVNYHGLDLAKFASAPREGSSPFEILSVGTLNAHKGFHVLLPALAGLLARGVDFHCTIIGGGPLEADLKQQIADLGLGTHVTMAGALKQAQVIPYYKKSDLFILMAQPEWHWGIPNVVAEALAAKLPVVTTLFGSITELIEDGVTGLIVPPKDADVLASALERLVKDAALRARLREAGHERVIRFFDIRKNITAFERKLKHEETPEFVA